MGKRVLVLGGYGNFGAFITRRLARENDLTVIVAGRSALKARELAGRVGAEWAPLDVSEGIDGHLKRLKPDILVHTCGPFQDQGYGVAEAAIRNGVHYLDLADGRRFVAGIAALDGPARAAGVAVVSGASTVPGLTSAVFSRYAPEFAAVDAIDAGIATAQKTNRGLATIRAVLSWAGKPFGTLSGGRMCTVHGWQGLRWRRFRDLGWRPLGHCDVPDLVLFPERVPGLRDVSFGGGLELPVLHLGLWSLTWLVRLGIVPNLAAAAPAFARAAQLFDVFGTQDSGFYVEITGRGPSGRPQRLVFELTARGGCGPMIPCLPAVVLVLKLARGQARWCGAMPCFGLVALDDLLSELTQLRVSWEVSRSSLAAGR